MLIYLPLSFLEGKLGWRGWISWLLPCPGIPHGMWGSEYLGLGRERENRQFEQEEILRMSGCLKLMSHSYRIPDLCCDCFLARWDCSSEILCWEPLNKDVDRYFLGDGKSVQGCCLFVSFITCSFSLSMMNYVLENIFQWYWISMSCANI